MWPGPSVPAAPPRFSMTSDWLRCFSLAVASARMTTSVVPPAGHGTIRDTGRAGKVYACAAPAGSALKPSTIAIMRVFIAHSPQVCAFPRAAKHRPYRRSRTHANGPGICADSRGGFRPGMMGRFPAADYVNGTAELTAAQGNPDDRPALLD